MFAGPGLIAAGSGRCGSGTGGVSASTTIAGGGMRRRRAG